MRRKHRRAAGPAAEASTSPHADSLAIREKSEMSGVLRATQRRTKPQHRPRGAQETDVPAGVGLVPSPPAVLRVLPRPLACRPCCPDTSKSYHSHRRTGADTGHSYVLPLGGYSPTNTICFYTWALCSSRTLSVRGRPRAAAPTGSRWRAGAGPSQRHVAAPRVSEIPKQLAKYT